MEYLIKGSAHIGIKTEDAKGCAEFYINNMGFRQFYKYNLNGVELNFVECCGCILEFIQTEDIQNNGSIDHIAFEVQGIEALVEELKLKGVDFETEHPNKYPDFFPIGGKNIFFKGPAGERVELFEYSR